MVGFNILHHIAVGVVHPYVSRFLHANGLTKKQRKARPDSKVPRVDLIVGRILPEIRRLIAQYLNEEVLSSASDAMMTLAPRAAQMHDVCSRSRHTLQAAAALCKADARKHVEDWVANHLHALVHQQLQSLLGSVKASQWLDDPVSVNIALLTSAIPDVSIDTCGPLIVSHAENVGDDEEIAHALTTLVDHSLRCTVASFNGLSARITSFCADQLANTVSSIHSDRTQEALVDLLTALLSRADIMSGSSHYSAELRSVCRSLPQQYEDFCSRLLHPQWIVFSLRSNSNPSSWSTKTHLVEVLRHVIDNKITDEDDLDTALLLLLSQCDLNEVCLSRLGEAWSDSFDFAEE